MTVSVATPVTVFQSTPSQRGRLCNADIFFTTCVFQSTPSQRGRRLLTVLKTVADTISIHALAKRATLTVYPCHFLKIYFNPRPRKEGDTNNTSNFSNYKPFQSTPSQRGRRVKIAVRVVRHTFQSTPSQRGRHIDNETRSKKGDFNPRPRKEGDCHFAFCKLPNIHFNPRPRKEGDKALMQRAIL